MFSTDALFVYFFKKANQMTVRIAKKKRKETGYIFNLQQAFI